VEQRSVALRKASGARCPALTNSEAVIHYLACGIFDPCEQKYPRNVDKPDLMVPSIGSLCSIYVEDILKINMR
jgi:hypothetical protein